MMEPDDSDSEHDAPTLNASVININEDEIGADLQAKLIGDRIGDTAYSEAFILKTMLQLQNVAWNKDLEDDLCFLWDSTLEPDVCNYIIAKQLDVLLTSVTDESCESRLSEILIGILANVFCSTSCDVSQISTTDVIKILTFLNTDDPLVLIQVLRYLKIVSHNAGDNPRKYINDYILGQIVFILKNSLHIELLITTLDVVVTITAEGESYDNVKGNVASSALCAFESIVTLKHDADSCVDEIELYSKSDVVKSCNMWIDILLNISLSPTWQSLHEFEDSFLRKVMSLLQIYCKSDDMIFQYSKTIHMLVISLQTMGDVLQFKPPSSMFLEFVRIYDKVKNSTYNCDIVYVSGTFCYLLQELNVNTFLDYIKISVTSKALVLKCLNYISCDYKEDEYDYKVNLDILSNDLKSV